MDRLFPLLLVTIFSIELTFPLSAPGPGPFFRGGAPGARAPPLMRGMVPPRRGGAAPPAHFGQQQSQEPSWSRPGPAPAARRPSPWEKGGFPPGAGARGAGASGYAEVTPNPYAGYPPLKSGGGPRGGGAGWY